MQIECGWLNPMSLKMQVFYNLVYNADLGVTLKIVLWSYFCFWAAPGRFKAYSWFCPQESLLMLRGSYKVLGIEPRLTRQAPYSLYFCFTPIYLAFLKFYIKCYYFDFFPPMLFPLFEPTHSTVIDWMEACHPPRHVTSCKLGPLLYVEVSRSYTDNTPGECLLNKWFCILNMYGLVESTEPSSVWALGKHTSAF